MARVIALRLRAAADSAGDARAEPARRPVRGIQARAVELVIKDQMPVAPNASRHGRPTRHRGGRGRSRGRGRGRGLDLRQFDRHLRSRAATAGAHGQNRVEVQVAASGLAVGAGCLDVGGHRRRRVATHLDEVRRCLADLQADVVRRRRRSGNRDLHHIRPRSAHGFVHHEDPAVQTV